MCISNECHTQSNYFDPSCECMQIKTKYVKKLVYFIFFVAVSGLATLLSFDQFFLVFFESAGAWCSIDDAAAVFNYRISIERPDEV